MFTIKSDEDDLVNCDRWRQDRDANRSMEDLQRACGRRIDRIMLAVYHRVEAR